uniref:Anaphase-promoting complex subunit 4 WD40 domain-containing protein n=1 Tax=Physcomitrium patens TaxID=3218 RepID=A9T9E9_PHYPA|nr:myosin heavy chain kinase A-like isoform X1 [Physcomitrium patens]PNR54901.1 hypothetical protein PHYPA_005794 [Physcomitrium patens]|eukprot:XP_024373457.1 myosin heavy chain kinase A-like isoform X1 [Physcomitrella patens]
MGFTNVASICASAYPRIVREVQWRCCNASNINLSARVNHSLQRQWQGKLHNSTILSLILHHSKLNASRLALVSSSIDAQLLTTCFKVRTTTDASVGGGVEVVERCRLWGSEGSGPIFSLGVAPDLDLLITGHAERELMLWRLTDWTSIPGVPLGGHTGWVRTLAIGKKIIISAACNFIKVWELPDFSDATVTNTSSVEHLGDLQLFKGDVLAVAMDDDCIYAATVDGTLHMWIISSTVRKLTMRSINKGISVQAHEGRINSVLVHNGVVISAGHDGCIRVWCKLTLEMKAEVKAAHEGSLVHALTATSNFLFSGGADQLVRIWDPESLASIGEPARLHAAGVRSLSAATSSSMPSSTETMVNSTIWLVSGDAQGEVVLWRLLSK